MITVESRALKAATLFKASGDVRYYLNGICLQKGRIVATDGHTALICECDGLEDLEENLIINIHGTILKGAGSAYIEKLDDKRGLISFENNERILAFSIIDGKFPDIDKVMPKEPEPVSEIGINESYIVKTMKANNIIFPRCKTGIKFEFFGQRNAINADAKDHELKVKYLIMPMRL